ncbi:xylose ABC transporter ATP-binding protein [Halanaerobium sp. ST460_2HS_T2]|uniref:xylose ABC transporter ATP-binding protein n=1 Tax=Halanaerobium sp. ST460_2HS_T2 TaxID=2183914 RepID=UPI000DF38052|nr:xylose ABC transporter ATP-binding protein [Halanaerobium sp. ST460_2HS_T2]RCW61880.1 xylose ABC transporter ATP-binding protein [Halanaerobium sp. ST460_2HS_T2]
MEEVLLETKDIIKDFPGVRALDKVSFQVKSNQIHALCGENGAGKSTLIKVLSGVYPNGSYEGQIFIEGEEKKFENIHQAEENGIAVIHQELTLFEEMNVAENIFMGNEISHNGYIDWNEMYDQTNKWLKKMKLEGVKPTTKVGELGVGKQQLIEIAKALAKNSRLLILDEPTASLTDNEVELLMKILSDLKNEGVTCIYISHKLNEVFEIADYISVLRDGEYIGGDLKDNLNEREVVKMMVGRSIEQMFPDRKYKAGKEILKVDSLDLKNYEGEQILENISFELAEGEILGIFGLIGAGRTEIANTLFGYLPGSKKGDIYLDQEKVDIKSPKEALHKGIALISEDRKRFGIIPPMSVKENISISFLDKFKNLLVVDENKEIANVTELVEQLNVKTASLNTKIVNLSGGNQQKAILAKNLVETPRVLIMDEPTRGIDVGAKQEIYELMNKFAEDKMGIIMISSELPEILGMSDRILVMHEGKITKEFDNRNKDISQEDIMVYATGGKIDG